MNKEEQKAISILAATIKDATKSIIEKANFDTTTTGVITQIVGKTHFVKINGDIYQVKSSISGLEKGQKVRINIPGNNWSEMYIAGTYSEYAINTSSISDFSTITNLEIDKLFS